MPENEGLCRTCAYCEKEPFSFNYGAGISFSLGSCSKLGPVWEVRECGDYEKHLASAVEDTLKGE